jgi:hypothetical protein
VSGRILRAGRIALLPALALIALLAWMFASPVGASPDDDYHLISTWCASPAMSSSDCAAGSSPRSREVPRELARITCFAQHPQRSAACQEKVLGDTTPVETDRGNFVGAYPPVYYAVMGLLASPDIQLSALAMRLLTIVAFLALTVALFVLLPRERRPTLLWGWLITSIPLGVFLLASNNPSSWAVIGLGTLWLALLGYFETTGRRRIALGAIFALAVVMAAGSRGDAALYAGFAIVLVLVLKLARSRAFLLSAILPIVMGLVALAFLLSARQVNSGISGFNAGAGPAGPDAASGAVEGATHLQGFGLLAYNALNAPYLWSGVLGTWGLGWIDTSMPWIVPLATIAAFVAVGVAGLARLDRRKVLVVALAVAVLWAIPVYTLQAGGQMVGDSVQPRYLLPLIVLLGGLVMLAPAHRPVTIARGPAYLVAAALAGANFVALFINMRRYISGTGGSGPDLDTGAEWWWHGMIAPDLVCAIGALAFGALVFLLVPRLASGRVAREALPV